MEDNEEAVNITIDSNPLPYGSLELSRLLRHDLTNLSLYQNRQMAFDASAEADTEDHLFVWKSIRMLRGLATEAAKKF